MKCTFSYRIVFFSSKKNSKNGNIGKVQGEKKEYIPLSSNLESFYKGRWFLHSFNLLYWINEMGNFFSFFQCPVFISFSFKKKD